MTALAGGGGFLVASLLWGAALAKLIDRRLKSAAATLLLAGVFSLFGVIHSPLPSSPILMPGAAVQRLAELGRGHAADGQTPYHWSLAYGAMALTLWAVGAMTRPGKDRAERPIETSSRTMPET